MKTNQGVAVRRAVGGLVSAWTLGLAFPLVGFAAPPSAGEPALAIVIAHTAPTTGRFALHEIGRAHV